MHELGIARSIASIVAEAANGRRVARVTLDVGAHAGIMPDAIAFCWDIVAKDAALDGARLEINTVAGRARCRVCDNEYETATLYQACACGGRDVERIAGEELKIREMELAEAA